jgi:hypothetical protein
MPLIFGTGTTSGTTYANPMVGEPGPTVQLKVDLSQLTAGAAGEVDAYGYLKPGVVFAVSGGLLVPVGSSGVVYGVVQEATRLAVTGADTGAVTTTTLGSETGDHFIAVCVSGVVQRDIGEDNMGRAYTANEIAGFALAGSLLRLTET